MDFFAVADVMTAAAPQVMAALAPTSPARSGADRRALTRSVTGLEDESDDDEDDDQRSDAERDVAAHGGLTPFVVTYA